MVAMVSFDKIDKYWTCSNGAYEIIFSGLYALYIDRSVANDICYRLEAQVGQHLHSCWPAKYEYWSGQMPGFLLFTDFPRPQQVELLRASEAMLRDVVADRVDPGLQLPPNRRDLYVKLMSEFTALMREELAAA
jgi:hypothetical protein